ncbi:MAG: class I SAM-dependent methyltransferase [Pontiella sp.]
MTNTPPQNEPWASPEVVARFSTSAPNEVLMRFEGSERESAAGNHLLDIGCGAGSNAVPLAQASWNVRGLDLSLPMLEAARLRATEAGLEKRLQFEQAPMDQLPVDDQSMDFIVAHGIWNLARSANEFRSALREAARVARPGAALFVYTFSRSTFAPEITPVQGEAFVYTEFSGRPQCFLTEQQLIEELDAAGFVQEPGIPITEYPQPESGRKPAIYEGVFRRR